MNSQATETISSLASPDYDSAGRNTSHVYYSTTFNSLAQPHVIVTTAPAPQRLGQWPQELQCPKCQNMDFSRVNYFLSTNNFIDHYIDLFLCCTLVLCSPYFFRYKSTKHYCSQCDYFLGSSDESILDCFD